MLKKFKRWANKHEPKGTPLWKALIFQRRLPWRYLSKIYSSKSYVKYFNNFNIIFKKTKPFKISIVITTKNNLDYLKPCLKTLLNQIYKNYEIIIVDQGSTDNTKEYIKSIKDEKIKLYCIKGEDVFLHSKGRNYGIDKSTGDIIVCVDGDIIFNKYCIKRIALAFTKNQNLFYEASKIRMNYKIELFKEYVNHNNKTKLYNSYGALQAMKKDNFSKIRYNEIFKGAMSFDDEIKKRTEKEGLKYLNDKKNILLHPFHKRNKKDKALINRNRKLLKKIHNEI